MLNKNVIRKQEDYNRIYKKGKSIGDRYVVMFCLKNNYGYNRISYLASKKVGNSVKRNRARRLMRESMRFNVDDIEQGYDLILIARNTINGKKCADVKKSIDAALRKLKLVKKK